LSYKDKSSRDVDQCRNAAIFELGMRAKDAYTVEGQVMGWISATGRIWTVDTVARVIVEPEGLDDPMYLVERTLHMSADGGQHTSLKFIPLNSLVLGENPGKK
jgi:prophage tail gpP-like protein